MRKSQKLPPLEKSGYNNMGCTHTPYLENSPYLELLRSIKSYIYTLQVKKRNKKGCFAHLQNNNTNKNIMHLVLW